MVLFSGTLRHYRKNFPKAHITICVKKYAKNLLEHCPYIDKIIVWEDIIRTRFDDHEHVKGVWRIIHLIRWLKISLLTFFKSNYDLLLLPVRTPVMEMHQFSEYASARNKICISDEAKEKKLSDEEMHKIYSGIYRVSENREFEHELTVHRDFLQFIGIAVTTGNIQPEIFITDDDKEWANNKIVTTENTTLLAICPGVTSKADKFYAAENYRKAISVLKKHKFSVIILGSKGEMQQCSKVEDALADCENITSLQNIAGGTTIRQLAACINQSDLTLSNETGALHIATALNKPSVGILGGGHFGRFYPWGDPEINLIAHNPLECYYCNWNCIYPEMICIHEIKPEIITGKILQLLNTDS